jgi:hypothetical protein
MELTNFNNFINDLNSVGYKNPFNLNEIVINDDVSFEFKFKDDIVYIINVTVYDTRDLRATIALKQIIKLIDEYHITLSIAPFILSDTGLKDEEFLSWIQDFNFEYINGILIRKN